MVKKERNIVRRPAITRIMEDEVRHLENVEENWG